MKLISFEQKIDQKILDRGRAYYNKDRVIVLAAEGSTQWHLLVDGTLPYRVTITVQDDDTLDWDCDCPYSYGPVCKHVAAALYAIQAEQNEEATPTPKAVGKRKKRKTRDEQIREALEPLTHRELFDLVVELSGQDRETGHMILARYSAPQGDRVAAKRLVTEALRLGRDGYSFLDYHGAANAGRAVWRLLERADTMLNSGEVDEALLLYQVILEETCVALGQADDSMGVLGSCPAQAVEGLSVTIPHLSSAGQTALFDYCLSTAASQPVIDWDWGWDLIAVARQLMTTPEQRAALIATLDQLATSSDERYGPSEYKRSRAAEIQLDVIEQQDGRAAMLPFMEAHIEYEEIRERLANYHIEDGDLEAAKRVCQAWLDDPPPRKPGLRQKFLRILLAIAEMEGDSEEQLQATEALYFDTGEMQLYRQVKALVGPTAWSEFRPDFLERLQAADTWRVRLDAIYLEEAMWPELLGYVQKHHGAATVYHKHLADRFPGELAAVYEALAIETLARDMSRGGYHEACGYLLKMSGLGQEEQAAAIVARWRNEYKNRPALRNELNKAFGAAG